MALLALPALLVHQSDEGWPSHGLPRPGPAPLAAEARCSVAVHLACHSPKLATITSPPLRWPHAATAAALQRRPSDTEYRRPYNKITEMPRGWRLHGLAAAWLLPHWDDSDGVVNIESYLFVAGPSGSDRVGGAPGR